MTINSQHTLLHGFLILILLASQITLKNTVPLQANPIQALPKPNTPVLELLTLGDKTALSYGLLLWLQQADYRSGTSLTYQELDYPRLIEWLHAIQAINTHTQYPQLLATRLWSYVPDDAKSKQMLDYVERAFVENPVRWRWLAEATTIAKHRLEDLNLALEYAQTLAAHAHPNTPYWAKDLRIILLEDLNEFESAELLIGALLSSGEIKDPYEINYLEHKLEALKKKSKN